MESRRGVARCDAQCDWCHYAANPRSHIVPIAVASRPANFGPQRQAGAPPGYRLCSIAYAIDKQKIVDCLYSGFVTIATQMASSCMLGYNPDLKPWPFDKAKANFCLPSPAPT